MPNHKIVHIEIPTSDAKTSASFYSEIFGWNTHEYPLPTATGETFWQFSPEEGPGGLFLNLSDGADNNRPIAPGDILLYITTDDAQATLAQAESLGGKIIIPAKQGAGEIQWGIFTDPTGNRIGVIQNATSQ